jgi:GntR family transcriptional regulator
MPLRISVDTESGLAPWRQVQDQIAHAITTGALAPGTRLPSIRQLARDLGLASGTVARAYRELETGGWVATGRAKGTVVAENAAVADRAALLRGAAADYVALARDLGADPDAAVTAVREAYDLPVSPSRAGESGRE